MAQITINIPDGQVARVRNAFASAYGYQATIPDPNNAGQTIPNPETKGQFTERKIREFIREVVAGQEATVDANTARSARIAEVNTNLTIS